MNLVRLHLVCRSFALNSTSSSKSGFLHVPGCSKLRCHNRTIARSFPLRTYATETAFKSPGPFLLRPWMLPHRADYGLRGTADCEPRPSVRDVRFSNFSGSAEASLPADRLARLWREPRHPRMREVGGDAFPESLAIHRAIGTGCFGCVKRGDGGGSLAPQPANVLHGEGLESVFLLPPCPARGYGDGSILRGACFRVELNGLRRPCPQRWSRRGLSLFSLLAWLRSFSVVYCTSVESDLGKVINTNRGREPVEMR